MIEFKDIYIYYWVPEKEANLKIAINKMEEMGYKKLDHEYAIKPQGKGILIWNNIWFYHTSPVKIWYTEHKDEAIKEDEDNTPKFWDVFHDKEHGRVCRYVKAEYDDEGETGRHFLLDDGENLFTTNLKNYEKR